MGEKGGLVGGCGGRGEGGGGRVGMWVVEGAVLGGGGGWGDGERMWGRWERGEYFGGAGDGAFEGFVAGGVALGGGGFGVAAHVEGRWLGISILFWRVADG
jgi:hypothetical protein